MNQHSRSLIWCFAGIAVTVAIMFIAFFQWVPWLAADGIDSVSPTVAAQMPAGCPAVNTSRAYYNIYGQYSCFWRGTVRDDPWGFALCTAFLIFGWGFLIFTGFATKMKGIRLEQLVEEGFALDLEGLIRFEHRWIRPRFWAAIGVVATLVLGGALMIMERLEPWHFFALLAACWSATYAVILARYFARPKSSRTGKALEKYRNLSRPLYEEVVYIDSEAKTYFTQVFGTPNDT